MGYGLMLLLFFMGWLAYLAYWLLSRGPPARRRWLPTRPTLANQWKNLRAEKHWARGENVQVMDDGTQTANIYQVAGNFFGDRADLNCIAFLVHETGNVGTKQSVSVIVDGLVLGYLSPRDALPLHARLQEAGMAVAVTSCDAHVGGGGTGLDGKKRRYLISLDVNWFEA